MEKMRRAEIVVRKENIRARRANQKSGLDWSGADPEVQNNWIEEE